MCFRGTTPKSCVRRKGRRHRPGGRTALEPTDVALILAFADRQGKRLREGSYVQRLAFDSLPLSFELVRAEKEEAVKEVLPFAPFTPCSLFL